MTDEAETSEHESGGAYGPYPEQRDWLLAQFVTWANVDGITTAITMNTGGLTVSGYIISGKEYFEAIADLYKEQFPPNSQGAVRDAILNIGNSMYTEEQVRAQQAAGYPPTFIHLRDARIYSNSGGPLPANTGVYWRGKIDAVDGFWIGVLSQEPQRRVGG